MFFHIPLIPRNAHKNIFYYSPCQSLRHHLESRSTHTKGRQWSDLLPSLSPQQCSHSSLQYHQPTSFPPTMLDGGRWTVDTSTPSHEPGCTTIHRVERVKLWSWTRHTIHLLQLYDCQVLLEQVSLSVSTTHASASLAPRVAWRQG